MPYDAPVSMWIIKPLTAGPAVNQNFLPAIACPIEVIMDFGEPRRAEMWNSGVKNPWC